MNIGNQLTDKAVLAELGGRLARQRIEAGFTQAQLAEEAGVSKRTLERVESGADCDLQTLIRMLRVLKLLDGMNLLVPEIPPSPVAMLKLQGKQRRRVGSPRRKSSQTSTADPKKSKWKWGDE